MNVCVPGERGKVCVHMPDKNIQVERKSDTKERQKCEILRQIGQQETGGNSRCHKKGRDDRAANTRSPSMKSFILLYRWHKYCIFTGRHCNKHLSENVLSVTAGLTQITTL